MQSSETVEPQQPEVIQPISPIDEDVASDSPSDIAEFNIDSPPSKATIKEFQKRIYMLCKEQYPNIIDIANLFIDRATNKYDNQASVEGVTGSGKSMFTFILVHVIAHMTKKVFDIPQQTLFIPSPGELKKEIKELKPLDVYWLDEAIRALDKKQWYKTDQIELNHLIKTERWKRNTIIYNIQRFSELTESFRNSNIFFRIYIVPRHSAILYIRDDDKDIEDPWHVRDNLSMKYKNARGQLKYKVALTGDERLKKEFALPNAYLSTLFPNLEVFPNIAPYWNYYEALKEKSRVQEQERNEKHTIEAVKIQTVGTIKALQKMIDIYCNEHAREKMNPYKVHKQFLSNMVSLERVNMILPIFDNYLHMNRICLDPVGNNGYTYMEKKKENEDVLDKRHRTISSPKAVKDFDKLAGMVNLERDKVEPEAVYLDEKNESTEFEEPLSPYDSDESTGEDSVYQQ